MSKRKAADSYEEDVVKKHTLDSDEEDDNAHKYEIMDDDEIEGQEDATIEFDGEIKITPFNMKEELEEGHFDKDGNYFLNKEAEIRDGWLDNIDWIKVQANQQHKLQKTKSGLGDSDSDDDDFEPFNERETYEKMTELMKPGETVLTAIKRLGKSTGSQANASSRWKTKKRNEDDKRQKKESTSTDSEEEKKKMLALTELADRMLHRGKTEIYNQTYEKLMYRIQSFLSSGLRANNAKNDGEVLDMFGDSFDENVEPKPSGSKESEAAEEEVDTNETMWEFKWENKNESEVYGPHTTLQMQQWVDDGYFSDGVWVRRCDQPEAQFHTSKRVDFELYL